MNVDHYQQQYKNNPRFHMPQWPTLASVQWRLEDMQFDPSEELFEEFYNGHYVEIEWRLAGGAS